MAGLQGKTALVTGAGIAIGQGVAIGLAQRGVRVAVHYSHSKEGAQETVRQIKDAGGEAVIVSGDLRFAANASEWSMKRSLRSAASISSSTIQA